MRVEKFGILMNGWRFHRNISLLSKHLDLVIYTLGKKKPLFIPSPLILSKPSANIINPSSVLCFLGLAGSSPILVFISLISHLSYDGPISLLPKYDPIPLLSCKDAVLLFLSNNPVPRLLFSG